MKYYVCLRDDDTSYHTQPEELIEGYGRYWGKVPITLAVVPFSHGSQIKMLDVEYETNRCNALRQWEIGATAEDLTEYHKVHPIGENKDIINELKRLRKIDMVEIAQHGVSHRYNEFGAESTKNQVTLPSIRDGMEYLSKIFETPIKTFIPPSNTIDRECARYVNSLGMNLFVSGGISYNSKLKKLAGYLRCPGAIIDKLARKKFQPIKRRDGLYMIGSFTYDVFKKKETIFDLVKGSLQMTGFAAVGTHYMLLDKNGYHGEHKEYRENYLNLIDMISSISGVEFVTAKKYYSLLKEKYYE